MPSMSDPTAMTGLPDPPRGHPRGRNPGDALLDREAVVTQDLHNELGRLDLLESELTEAEDLIDHLLGELRAAFDVGDGFALEPVEPRGGNGGALLRGEGHRRQDGR